MSEESLASLVSGTATRFRESALVRVLGTAFLVLLLQIPVGIIDHTINERRGRKDEAMREVTQTWGGEQEVAGLILTVPSIERWVDDQNNHRERTVVRHFLPRLLSVRAQAATEVRRRGIFDVPLYVSTIDLTGTFVVPGERAFNAAARDILWDRASVSLGLTEPRSIRSVSPLSWRGADVALEPGPGEASLLNAGLHAAVDLRGPAGTAIPFSLSVTMAGSGRLSFVPLGDVTEVHVTSPWTTPSFDGSTLPVSRTIGTAGFEADWKVLHLGRNFPSAFGASEVDGARLSRAAFGVALLSPVDTYRTNERAVKYQLLFLSLTFLAFTLFELLGGLRVHAVQSLLVGLALCLFYLLLLSLSEHVGFTAAYGAAAAAVLGLVTFYVRFVLGGWRRAGVIAGQLGALYLFLFVLLQIQDYALLVGSIGLFVVLAAVMTVTRRVDWYHLRGRRETARGGRNGDSAVSDAGE